MNNFAQTEAEHLRQTLKSASKAPNRVILAQSPGTDPFVAGSYEKVLKHLNWLHGGRSGGFVSVQDLAGNTIRKELTWIDSLGDEFKVILTEEDIL